MFFISTFLFYVAGYTLLPTLPLLLAARGGSPAEVGVVMGSFTAAALVFRGPVGWALTRYSTATLLRAGQLLLGAGFAAFFLLPGVLPLMAGRVLQGVGLAAFNTSAYVYLAERGGVARRAEYISLFGLAANLAMALAPAAGSVLLELGGEHALFGASLAVSLVGLALVPPARMQARPEGERLVLWDFSAWRPAVAMLGFAVAYGTVMVFVPLAIHHAALTQGWIFFTTYSAGIVATRLLTRRLIDRGHRLAWALSGCATMLVGVGVLAGAGSWAAFLPAALLFGVGVGIGHPTLMAYVLETVPEGRRNGAAALGTMAFDAGTAGGAALSGYVAGQVSYAVAFGLSGALFIVLLIPLLLTPKPERTAIV